MDCCRCQSRSVSPTLASFNRVWLKQLAALPLCLSAVQHRPALHSPHAVVVLRDLSPTRRSGSICMYVGVSIGIHVRISTHTHIAAPIRQLDVHPGISYMDRQVPSCATLPLPLPICTSTLIAPQLFIAGQGGVLGSQSARRHMRRDS
jgi:hypothetical protein